MDGDLERDLRAEIELLRVMGLQRELPPRSPGERGFTSGSSGERGLTRREPVDLCSNDTLGLSRHPDVIAAARSALEEHGAGARASRLLGGDLAVHRLAEERAAEWLGCPAALLFPSTYQANLGAVRALTGRGAQVFSDERNHASLIDAARLSRARVFVYRHADAADLERRLAQAPAARRRLVLTESIFSMDGDRAPLADLCRVAERHGAWLVVDEAHAVGLIGPHGAGACAELDECSRARVALRIAAGGKALGAAGGLALGSRAMRDTLVNAARTFVYTTAVPPPVAAALAAAIPLARNAAAERAHALALARELAAALDLPEPAAAIVPVIVGDPALALELAAAARERGFAIGAVRPPTVPEGSSRVRVTCHAFNRSAEIASLAELLAERLRGRRAPTAARVQGSVLVVAGTDTGVGKTVVAAALLAAALRKGPARYWKPVQTGPDSDTGRAGELALAPAAAFVPPLYELALPASPHTAAAAERVEIDPARISAELAALRRDAAAGPIVLELAGGLLVPYRIGETQADWLERERLPLVLVARSGLGTLNHTLLSLEALRARGLEPRALILVGEPHPQNRATLERMSAVARIVELPRLEPLDVPALAAWAERSDLAALFEA